MEINTQQIEALLHLQEQGRAPRKQSDTAGGFEALLNQQLDGKATSGIPNPPLMGVDRPDLYSQIMVDTPAENTELDPDSAVMMAAFEQASGALDLWDSYTQTLGTSNTDTALRDAWGLLEGIDSQVSQLRANPAFSRSSALDSILNELEILTATEKFKFNRGDYL